MKRARMPMRSALTLPLAASVLLAACAPAMVPNAREHEAAPAPVEVKASSVLPAGTLEGMIATFDGQDFVPVAGATVQLVGTSLTAVTDAEGRYAIKGATPGTYKVVAAKDGFKDSEGQVILNPAAGTPRVNLAMAKAVYGVQQIAAFNATVTGVVTDPRGAALPNATVKILSNAANNGAGSNATTTANVNGFYSHQLPNVAVNTSSPGQVQVTAYGQSPGQVRLETKAVRALALTSATLVANTQCDAYTMPSTPTFPNGTYSPMGSTATLKATDLSARADEFYILLESGGFAYYVLADTVTPVPATNDKTVTFRIPYTMPGNTFTAKIVPFGVMAGNVPVATAASSNFVTNYTQANFDANLTYAPNSAIALQTVKAGTILANLFVGGDTQRYTITLANANPDVSQDIRLEGTVPVGSTILQATAGGTAITGANLGQPDGTGKFFVQGFNVPTSGNRAVVIDFVAPVTMTKGTHFQVTGLAVRMPSAGLVKTSAPNSTATGATTQVRNVDGAALTITKSIADFGAANDGVGEVTLTITPTGADALGRFTITDLTRTDQTAPASRATFVGTTTLPAATVPIGVDTNDKLVVKVDGGAEVTVQVFSSNYDLETLVGQINNMAGLQGLVTASRDGSNRFKLEHNQQGVAKTLEIVGGAGKSTANMLTRLGLTASLQAGTDGVQPETGAGTFSAVQNANTTWAMTWVSSNQNATGAAVATFTIDPPAAFGAGTTFTHPIVVKYRIKKAGGAALTLGGSAAGTNGATITTFNLIPPFAAGTSQTLNKTVADPAAAVPNL